MAASVDERRAGPQVTQAAARQAGTLAWRRLPYCLRILLENCLRNQAPGWAGAEDIVRLQDRRTGDEPLAVPVRVSRVVLPDSSGLPALMDLAALRDALARHGGDPAAVQPRIPVDLVIDHSLMVDDYGHRGAIDVNIGREFERNAGRYRFFKWGQRSFDNFRVAPPGMGIIHQVHLERLAQVVHAEPGGGPAYPEFVLGGDSHTPMVNGLGVLAWGVGGVEIEAAVLDVPYAVPVTRVVGVRLDGRLPAGTTVTDLVLTVTERLRGVGVTGAFVEFFGPAYDSIAVPDRATIANMAPEYGATAAYFPVDRNTLAYLRQTGRDEAHVAMVEDVLRRLDLFQEPGQPDPDFDEVIEIDLGAVETSLAGPKRPESRLPLRRAAEVLREALGADTVAGGYAVPEERRGVVVELEIEGRSWPVTHGFLAIAAITACTSTSNPSVMIAAGLLARNAVARGLTVPPYVKTSLAPGSLVVRHYLTEMGLMPCLERLGFYVVGFGCTTCSGKSGDLHPAAEAAVTQDGLVAAAVASSNRNFEGRLHRQVGAGFLASPPLVVAFALAGRTDIDLTRDALGEDGPGRPVYLADIWPSPEDVEALLEETRRPESYERVYEHLFEGTPQWRALEVPQGLRYPWDPDSTYILRPPFLDDARILGDQGVPDEIAGARALGVFGDGLSTDHISPAGEIAADSLPGRYLSEAGVPRAEFNAFTMRRGNHHVMVRGTYAHARTRNLLVPDRTGGFTLKLPEGEVVPVFEAAERYRCEGTPMLVFGGQAYGMGSSRDWAAKGPALLGVGAIVARSFERIHRSNLVALGIVPLVFEEGESLETLGLTGRESFTLSGLHAALTGRGQVRAETLDEAGGSTMFTLQIALSSPAERDLLERGGIFRQVFQRLAAGPAAESAGTG